MNGAWTIHWQSPAVFGQFVDGLLPGVEKGCFPPLLSLRRPWVVPDQCVLAVLWLLDHCWQLSPVVPGSTRISGGDVQVKGRFSYIKTCRFHHAHSLHGGSFIKISTWTTWTMYYFEFGEYPLLPVRVPFTEPQKTDPAGWISWTMGARAKRCRKNVLKVLVGSPSQSAVRRKGLLQQPDERAGGEWLVRILRPDEDVSWFLPLPGMSPDSKTAEEGHQLKESIACWPEVGPDSTLPGHWHRLLRDAQFLESQLQHCGKGRHQNLWSNHSIIARWSPEEASADEWREVAQQFEQRWKLPHCLGAFDGRHSKICQLLHSWSLYFGSFSASSCWLWTMPTMSSSEWTSISYKKWNMFIWHLDSVFHPRVTWPTTANHL